MTLALERRCSPEIYAGSRRINQQANQRHAALAGQSKTAGVRGAARRAEGSGPAHSLARRFLSPRGGDETLALRPLARELAHAAHRLGALPSRSLRRLLVESLTLHFAEHALALQLLFQDAESLVDVVVANQYLQRLFLSGVPRGLDLIRSRCPSGRQQ